MTKLKGAGAGVKPPPRGAAADKPDQARVAAKTSAPVKPTQRPTPPPPPKQRSGQLFVNEVQADDPVQGDLADCYLLASASSVAEADPNAIRSAITDHENGTYTVRLYERTGGAPTPKYFTVDGERWIAPEALPGIKAGEVGATSSDAGEQWVSAVEKAYAMSQGGYPAIDHPRKASEALFALTGKESRRYDGNLAPGLRWEDSESLWTAMQEATAQRRPMVAGTWASSGTRVGDRVTALFQAKYKALGLIPSHSYSVLGVFDEGGERFIRLRNPYGRKEPGSLDGGSATDGRDDGDFTMKFKDWQQAFYCVDVLEP